MAALISIVGITGLLLVFTLTFAGPQPEIMISIAALPLELRITCPLSPDRCPDRFEIFRPWSKYFIRDIRLILWDSI